MFLWNIAVTSLAEVWIEIWLEMVIVGVEMASLPLRKCGLKSRGIEVDIFNLRHFPCGSVDWNLCKRAGGRRDGSHFPCGSVDWNRGANVQMQYNGVTSLAEVWIEIQNQQDFSVYWLSLPLRKCGLKFASVPDLIFSYGRHFPCGSVDWNSHKAGLHDHPDVTSLAEVWIEISLLPPKT